MFNIGPAEMIVILIIALIVFGPKRLPEIGRTVGKGLREFRKASQDLKDEFTGTLDDEDEAPSAPPAASPASSQSAPAEPARSEAEVGPSQDGASSGSLDGSPPTA